MKEEIGCDVIKFYKIMGKKWTVELFCNINESPVSYNQLFTFFGHKISPTLLSKRLKELVEFGFVKKTIINDKLIYIITPKGNELKGIIKETKNWLKKNKHSIPKDCIKENECVNCVKRGF